MEGKYIVWAVVVLLLLWYVLGSTVKEVVEDKCDEIVCSDFCKGAPTAELGRLCRALCEQGDEMAEDVINGKKFVHLLGKEMSNRGKAAIASAAERALAGAKMK